LVVVESGEMNAGATRGSEVGFCGHEGPSMSQLSCEISRCILCNKPILFYWDWDLSQDQSTSPRDTTFSFQIADAQKTLVVEGYVG